MARRLIAATATCSALLSVAACTSDVGNESGLSCDDLRWSGSPRARNLVLIVNDTMRRDRPGVYGGPARTPVLDRFAESHLVFDRAYTQAPWTTPSVATIFTSHYPSQHGVLSHPQSRQDDGPAATPVVATIDVLHDDFTTLAETLRAAGYRTAAFVANPWLERRFGFAQGFETYDDSLADWDAPGDRIGAAGLEWLGALDPDEPFFLYLHYMDSHRPYQFLTRADVAGRAAALRNDDRPLEPQAADLIAKLVWLEERVPAVALGIRPSRTLLELAYDKGIEAFDSALGTLLDGLARQPAFDRTAVIVTSDHGEALYERGYDNHGNGLYDDEVAVPFAARLPGVESRSERVDCPLGLIDLMPTICSYLVVPCPDTVFGQSLLEAAEDPGERAARPILTEGVMRKPKNRAVRDLRYKLLWQPQLGPDGKEHALFDLVADAGETTDLLVSSSGDPAVGAIFERLVDVARRGAPKIATPRPQTVPLDPELEERLRSLGYIE